ncbi:MAG TPA: helix-turn-helix transcriptional regulator [Candidatus Baltobacteraceae bacterium]|nr:helix-turn-helix transcriptional regulator [Candidatus Baltobacteraceae bacterium]
MAQQPEREPDFAAAVADYRAARFTEAAASLREIVKRRRSDAQAAMLLARTQMRLGDPAAALAALSSISSSRAETKAEIAILKGAAFARTGDSKSAAAQFRTAASLATTPQLRGELANQKASLEWIERRLDRAEKEIAAMPADTTPELQLSTFILRGAIASAREKLPEQGALLLEALRRYRDNANDAYLQAMLVTHIAALAVELPSSELRDAAVAAIDSVRWTRDVADLQFHALRAVAWRHALEGDEFNAFRRLKQALAAASSDEWRVAALADRAYLAQALGEPRWAAQELRDAHELASGIDWNAVAGEEKLALPVLAQLFAQSDPAVAIGYVSAFAGAGTNYPRILSSRKDRRIDALQAYSLGQVQSALGETAEAKRLLQQAWKIYSDLGIHWRAARAAIALAPIDKSEPWNERASSLLQSYPRSWMAREIRGAGQPRKTLAGPDAPRLTAAQSTVLDLLLQGRSTEEIAASLERSSFTVRNHIKAVLKAYGVNSRAALVVRAAGH